MEKITEEITMKTLDEVIFEAPYTPTPWEVDALHYLKEYRSDKLQWEADRKLWQEKAAEFEEAKQRHIEAAKSYLKEKAEMEEISSDYVALKQWWTEQQVNPPLSWDELKTLEGKPVWVETKYYSSRWAVITDVDDVRICFVGEQLLDSEIVQEMGKTWQAYRKERTNNGHQNNQ